jgi:predicted nucleic acid-binding protein
MAEASRAQYLVTGDKKDLLALGTIGGTRIVTARHLVEKLEI